ncbi:hypothetical protein BDA99DRAFT_300566 [Phascolomyces articulosus]|uniref:Uncharacterized protein n=1 Tax=Phascolomyces articulosus TaxID=60185 RepID=A0AAD5KMU6_9FUNG|nr:hypothetical protein BDA99DRAFT_300566 [Phascolomyces articulosus]
MRELRTIVIVTLGFQPASVAYLYFRDGYICYSLGENECITKIGMPEIIDYNNNCVASTLTLEPNASFRILMPHLHPGFVSYGPTDPIILRFMYLTWCKTILLIDVVLDMSLIDVSNNEPGSRQFCEEALQL